MARHDDAHSRHSLPGSDRTRPHKRRHATQGPPTRPQDGDRPHPTSTHDKGH